MGRYSEMQLVGVILTIWLGVGHAVAGPSPDASWWDRHVESISCTKPGYFVNPIDCHSFYRCVDKSTWHKPALQRYDFTCPTGMVFDVAFSVCTKPGANGCADPWWPGSGEAAGKGASNPGSSESGANSLERLPSLFSETRGQGGSGRRSGSVGGNGFGGDPLDIDFGSPSLETSTKPAASVGLFSGGDSKDPLDADFGSPGTTPGGRGLFGGGSGKDPLDIDFGSPGSSTRPGSGSPFGGRRSKDPLDADFGSSGGSTKPGGASPFEAVNNGKDPLDVDFDSPSPGSSKKPGGPFSGGSSRDPLDADFGSPSPGSSKTPGGPFSGGSSRDPLDADFGSRGSAGSGPGGNSNDIPPFLRNRNPSARPSPGSRNPFASSGNEASGDPLDVDFGSSSGNSASPEDSSSNSSEGKDNDRNGESPNGRGDSSSNESGGGSENWWDNNSPTKWDRDDKNPNSIEFDNWDSGVSSTTTEKPPPLTWGGAPRPSITNPPKDDTPWIPTGPPWGSDSSNDLGGGSPSPSIPQSPSRPSSSFPQSPRPPAQSPPSSSYPQSPRPPAQSPPSSSYPQSPRPPAQSPPSSSYPQPPRPPAQSPPSFSYPQSPRPPPPPPPSSPLGPSRSSWWDPPYAMPYRPRGPGPLAPINRRGPLPNPWSTYLYPYRPRYPNYEVVAYPTWPPGPPYRNPIIVVYSNSKKK